MGLSPLSVTLERPGMQAPGSQQKAQAEQVTEDNLTTDRSPQGRQGCRKPAGEGGAIRETMPSSEPEGARKRRGSWRPGSCRSSQRTTCGLAVREPPSPQSPVSRGSAQGSALGQLGGKGKLESSHRGQHPEAQSRAERGGGAPGRVGRWPGTCPAVSPASCCLYIHTPMGAP